MTELVDVSHVDVAQQTVVHCLDACWIAALALIIALFCHLQVYSFGVLMWECLTGAACATMLLRCYIPDPEIVFSSSLCRRLGLSTTRWCASHACRQGPVGPAGQPNAGHLCRRRPWRQVCSSHKAALLAHSQHAEALAGIKDPVREASGCPFLSVCCGRTDCIDECCHNPAQAAGAPKCSAAAGAAAARMLAGGPRSTARLQGHPVRTEGAAAKPCSLPRL